MNSGFNRISPTGNFTVAYLGAGVVDTRSSHGLCIVPEELSLLPSVSIRIRTNYSLAVYLTLIPPMTISAVDVSLVSRLKKP